MPKGRLIWLWFKRKQPRPVSFCRRTDHRLFRRGYHQRHLYDYMKTVYARAGNPAIIQLPLTSFDKNFALNAMAAESWEQSTDGLTRTFKLRDGLVWSDGAPLVANDYILALHRAATTCYDFAWHWDYARGIKNLAPVTEGKADVATLGISAPDDKTIVIVTEAPKPYLPGVVSLWYPVPVHVWEKLGDEYAANVETLVSSGPFIVELLEKKQQLHGVGEKPHLHRPLAIYGGPSGN